MLRSLYARVIALSTTRAAPFWLFAVAFAEASFFPLPPDLLLIPMVLAAPRRAWMLACVCTAGSVLGGCFGYWIGASFFDLLAGPVVRFYHAQVAYAHFLALYQRWGFWAIMIKGLTPIPFKLVTIAAGAAHVAWGPFLLACVITRGARFFLFEALPLRIFGDRARVFIEQRLGLVLLLVLILLVAGVAALKLL